MTFCQQNHKFSGRINLCGPNSSVCSLKRRKRSVLASSNTGKETLDFQKNQINDVIFSESYVENVLLIKDISFAS